MPLRRKINHNFIRCHQLGERRHNLLIRIKEILDTLDDNPCFPEEPPSAMNGPLIAYPGYFNPKALEGSPMVTNNKLEIFGKKNLLREIRKTPCQDKDWQCTCYHEEGPHLTEYLRPERYLDDDRPEDSDEEVCDCEEFLI